LIRIAKILDEATAMADMPQFKGLPLKLAPGKKKFLPAARIKLSDVLDRYERIAGVKG
jgi:formylmethanofuran dehydrogenase subunit D